MPSFVRLRSPLLRALADWRDPDTPRILRRRRIVIGGIVALAAILVLLTRAGRLPLPALDVFYVLHDYGVLPFWGYTWTFFAPYSLTWWSLAAIAAVVWLATFLTRWSAVRGLHARLGRVVVVHLVADGSRSPRYGAWLTRSVDWLTARGLGAELLKDVVHAEQMEALTAIVGGGSTLDERGAWRLVRLTDLLARLTSSAAAPARERWRALAIWHQASMWLDRRIATSPQTGSVAAPLVALGATGRFLLDRLAEIDDVEGDALSSGLRRDLGLLASESLSARSTDFVRSILERLDALWALAEHGSNDAEASTLIARAPDDVLEVQGSLVASIGLHAASRMEDPHLAAAHVQAFEALSFVRYLDVAGREGGRVARALTAETPARDHYRFVADIAERHRERWASGPAVGGSAIDEADRHERMRIDALHDASAFALRASPPFTLRAPAARLRHRIRSRPLPLGRRVDPVLLGGLAAATVLYGAAVAALVLLVESAYTPRWSARALPDRRLLANVRQGLAGAPFLDAVFHAPDRQLVVSQAGGVLHSYDPATGLWSTARPFGPNDLARPDIRLLASAGDGNADALWGLTTDGGLVRRVNGRWEVVVGDTKFLGRRGTPIQQAELSTVAASADGKWLLAAAGADGVGVQDLERRRWLSRDEISQDASPSAVTHAVWWRDRFYVGGSEGVSELEVDTASMGRRAARPLSLRRVKGLEGAVVALEPTAAEGLFVLATVACENGPSGCVRLSRVPHPFAKPDVLIDERNRYPELSLDRLFYAVQWKERLLLAGGSGLFDYDARLHTWKRHAAETISAIGPCASSSCFYYGYGGRSSGVALFTPQTMTGEAPLRWALPGEQPTRIAAGAPERAAVLTAAGRAYALAPGSLPALINPAASSPVPLERYRGAVTFGDKVLFFGQPGALLHDIVRRNYAPLFGVPQWLRSPASIVAASGAFLFGLEARGGSYDAHVAPQQQVELGTLFFNTSKPFPIEGPLRAVDASSADVLRVIDGRGRVQSIAASGVTALTGGRVPALARARLLDVAATADLLGVATAEGVRLYSMRTRSWGNPLPAPADERVVDIAARNGTWIARSDANRLMTIGAQPAVLIGGGDQMPRRPPTDARAAGSNIYLSWPGTIQRYDARSRQVAATWNVDAAAPATLTGVIGSEPLSVAGGVARLGAREIARGVRSMFTAGSELWMTREETNQRYLEGRPLASLTPGPAAQAATPSCLFRSSTTGAGAGVLNDARRLSAGVVAVTTDAGLRLHSRNRHSWYPVAGLLPDTGRGRLSTLGSTLIVSDGTGSRATLQIVRSSVTLPDSCAAAPARVDRAPEVVTARAFAIDEQGRKAYVVKEDGGVARMDEASTTALISGEQLGPPEADVVRLWHFPEAAASLLWAVTASGLWQYDLEHHRWSEIVHDYSATLRRLEDLARRPSSPTFRIGTVTFYRDVSAGLLATLHDEGGRTRPAYANRAFIWDRGRRGIAIDGRDGALLLTDAGVHAADSSSRLSSFDPGPPGLASPADRLTSGPDLVPRMLRGDRWYRRVAAGVWEPAAAPSTDGVLVEDEGLAWSRRNGSIVVETEGTPVSILTGGDGAQLSIDRLVGAAAYGTEMAFLTPGFIELAARPLAPLGAALFRAPQGDTLESATIDGREVMWLTRAGWTSIWNPANRTFEPAPPQSNLVEGRALAEIGPLRLTRVKSAIEGALRVADQHGRTSWMPIDLTRGRFPFDVVRSVAVVANALYVGTDAGLQVYDGIDAGLERARVIALAPNASPASPTVDRIGESCSAPGTAVACGPRGCVRQGAGAFVDAPADALSCRLRGGSALWSWQVDPSGLSGRYLVTPVRATPSTAPPVTLTDGQLAHDEIDQIVSSGGRTFTVWHDRYVGVHPTGLGLAGARNHAFDLPVRLVSVTAPVPMLRSRDRDLPPGLYAIEGPGSRMWRYEKEGWTIVTDGAETAAIADCASTPPLLQRRRLRLVQRAGRAAPIFETRMPAGAWTPLAWDAALNRFALDVWQDIAVDRQTLWTATPAGLVSRDGNWSFNPDTFRVVAAPPAESGRRATDLRVDGTAADVRYDGARTYRISLDDAAPERTVRVNQDPFAEKAFDVDARYWSWRVTGRTGSSAGQLTGTWNGEPIAMANGRFDFDAINSMAVFQNRLHIATSTRGWFTFPVDSVEPERRSRPTHASISPLDVTKIYGSQDPDQPELCLQGADGQFVRLAPGGASRRTQGCPVLAARTDFWRYTRDGSTVRILPPPGAARPGERRLVDGRFTDDVITGAPVTGTKNGRTVTLVPTSAAVMWWDAAGRTSDMHAPPFQGKPDAPRLLQWTAGGSPAYVADGTLYSLEDDDKPRGSWTVRLPPNAVFERIANGPGPLLSIDWSADGRRHHTVVDPRNGSVSHDDIPIDARRIPAYFQRAMAEVSHDGLIRLRLRDHVVSAYAASQGWPIIRADDSFQLLAGISYGTRAILVGPRHVIEVNMERVARAVYSGAAPPPPGADQKK